MARLPDISVADGTGETTGAGTACAIGRSNRAETRNRPYAALRWNFRAERIGNPTTIYALLGSYVPLARTRAERDARRDPRPSIEERYKDRDDYLQKIRKAANTLVKERFILEQDVEDVVQRATTHWDYANRAPQTN